MDKSVFADVGSRKRSKISVFVAQLKGNLIITNFKKLMIGSYLNYYLHTVRELMIQEFPWWSKESGADVYIDMIIRRRGSCQFYEKKNIIRVQENWMAGTH